MGKITFQDILNKIEQKIVEPDNVEQLDKWMLDLRREMELLNFSEEAVKRKQTELFERLNLPVLIFKPGGAPVFMNSKFAQLFCGDTNRLEVDDLSNLELYRNVVDNKSKALQQKIRWSLENEQKWFILQRVEFYTGQNTQLLADFFIDITQSEVELIELKENEERLRHLFDDSADATLLIENNSFVDCNKATLDILRMDSKKSVLNTHPSLLSPEFQPDNRLSREKAEEMMNIAFEKGSHRFEWVHKRANGESFYAEVLLTKIKHRQKHLLHCVWRDITERKNAEKALKASEESYKFLFEGAADGILIGNEKGIIINANASIEKITGYKIDELLGKSISILFPKDILNEKPLRYDLVLAGETVLNERSLRRKDGTHVVIEMNTKKVGDGRLQAYIRDITSRKESEKRIIEKNIELQATKEKLKRSNSELRWLNNALETQKEELRIAKEKAEESDRLKSAFLANMSHEIRTPMNGILGFAELLKEPELTGQQQNKYVEVIQESGERMLTIINDLVDISRIEAGQVEVNVAPFDLNRLMDSLYAFFTPETQVKHIRLSYTKSVADGEFIIKSDEPKVTQILTNLIKNAIKFTEEGHVSFGYKVHEGRVEFFVKDSGIGIHPDFKDDVFQRFKQATSLNSVYHAGAGLGLSISKAFVEMLGGQIGFDSEVGNGTRFYFTIRR